MEFLRLKERKARAMIIEIQQAELEALIQQRLDNGGFRSIEDMLTQAIRSLPVSDTRTSKQNLADFLLSSPLAGSGLITERAKDTPLPLEL
jgi:hypothetical protein